MAYDECITQRDKARALTPETGAAPRVVAAASAFPKHYTDQQTLAEAIVSHWSHLSPGLQARAKRFHMNCGVDGRHHALPADAWKALQGFGARSRVWSEVGIGLAEDALRRALAEAEWDPASLDALYFVSITGVSAPSLDAWLVGRLGLSPRIKRIPIFGLGCGAGAMGLTHASDFLKGHPGGRAALVSVELCSLTFQANDPSPANMVASGLFGDGAAAVLLEGASAALATHSTGRSSPKQTPNAPHPRVVATRSVLFEDTAHLMGWAIVDEGFQIELSPALPELVREHLGDEVDAFLADEGLSREDIAGYIAHTGGPKVIDAAQASLDLPPERLSRSRDNLRRYGNLSSAAVLVLLEDFINNDPPSAGSHTLLFAMGPGFALELVLLRW